MDSKRGFPFQDQESRRHRWSKPRRTNSFHSRQLTSRSSVEIWFYRLATAVEEFNMLLHYIYVGIPAASWWKCSRSSARFKHKIPSIVFRNPFRLQIGLHLGPQSTKSDDVVNKKMVWKETKRKFEILSPVHFLSDGQSLFFLPIFRGLSRA